MSDRPQTGRFVWYELMTSDRDAALSFYSELFGWQWQHEDMGPMGTYSMAHTGDTYHAGLVTLPKPDIPPHWGAYVTVPDVDRATEQATALGGQVLVPGTDIPNVGRFAAIQDPSGGVIYPFKGSNPAQPETPDPAPHGHFTWNELLTSDPAACEPFYREIFGWTVSADEMPDWGKYWLFHRGEKVECGMMPLPDEAVAGGAPSHWLPYVAVDDVAAVLEKATGMGAEVKCPPTDIPKMGTFAVMADPQGATISLWRKA
jgi:predicted enzyme related to lactoylglutathione lyase